MKQAVKKAALPLVLFAVFIAVWQAVCVKGGVSPILLPSPADTFAYLVSSTREGLLPEAVLVTLSRIFLGYTIAVLLGLLFGVLMHASTAFKSTVKPVALGLQTLPSICWAPLAILWFGQSEAAMYFVVIMGSVWAVCLSAEDSIRSVPALYIKAAKVMGAGKAELFKSVIIPAAMPGILSGAKLGWAFAWRSLMSAEIYILITEHAGLGQLLHFGRELNATDQVMAVMAVIIVIGFLSDRLIFVPIENRMRRVRG
ncbi:MAG: ABC transporter permease [Alphaproteobacteria bacterium]|nr:ABC transporter permease [Alphaproteobacteria bacterium]